MLGVAAVMVRYGLRDRRAARRLMDEAGSFRLGANLYVRFEDLTALEERRKVARRVDAGPKPREIGFRRARPSRRTGAPEVLVPGWWRDDPDRECG